jgi:thiamine biosynthesis lipoprotein
MTFANPHRIRILSLLLLFVMACSPKEPEPDLVRRTQFLMGTLVEITVRDADHEKANRAIDLAFDEMARLEKLMSSYRPDSEISNLNQESGRGFIRFSPEALEVVQRGIYWGEQSYGALDITIGPVTDLWRFEEDHKTVPAPEILEQAVRLVDFQNIQIDDVMVRLAKPGMSINLGAVAKGYAVDRAMQVLTGQKIEHALVNAGGDLMALGRRSEKRAWRIGLQHPREPEDMIASFEFSGRAVATSGDYQRYFIHEGNRYHHILNPADGKPAKQVISATVLGPTVMDADAIATAVFVMGPEKGIHWIDQLDGVEGMVVNASGDAV